MARLDRLGKAKKLAQIAAALGRECVHAVLAAVSEMPPARLRSALDQLIEAQLLLAQGHGGAGTYQFSHALVQDAAYSSMLLGTRRSLHRRIAEVLEQAFRDIAETEPQVIAHHLTEGQLNERAIFWWRRAGQRNAHASANIEAIAHFERCLKLLAGLPEGRKRDLMELDVRIDLGVPLTGVGGYTAPQFLANTARAVALADRMEDSARLYPVLWGQITHYFSTGDMPTALTLARQFLEAAVSENDRGSAVWHRLASANWSRHAAISREHSVCTTDRKICPWRTSMASISASRLSRISALPHTNSVTPMKDWTVPRARCERRDRWSTRRAFSMRRER